MSAPLVTALVSTYCSERYLRGCLDDLLAQTLVDQLEIVVVDACSPEGEGAIVREYQARFPRLHYVRTGTREHTSESFQRATALARGRYLTTANTDDRHRVDFLERMVGVLDAHAEFGLVYADSRITQKDNDTFAASEATHRFAMPDYSPLAALSCCLFGAQAVWRRGAHDEVGTWDPRYRYANDQDMFLRIALRFGAVHLQEDLGLFLQRSDSNSGADNQQATLRDILAVLRHYRTTTPLPVLFPALQLHPGDVMAEAAVWFELGNAWALGPYTDAALALQCFQRAVALPLHGNDQAAVRKAFANNVACILACAGDAPRALASLQHCRNHDLAARNAAHFTAAHQRGATPRLRDLEFAHLPHAVVEASRTVHSLRVARDGSLSWSEPRQQVPWECFEGPNGVPIAERTATLQPLPAAPAPASRPIVMVQYGWGDAGGGTLLPREVAKAIAATGRRVAVVCAAAEPDPSLPPYAVRRSREQGVELFAICNRDVPFSSLRAPALDVEDARAHAVFDTLLAELQPEVVHFWNLHGLGMSLPQACRARGIATVWSSQNCWSLCPRLYLLDERLGACSGPSEDGSKCATCVREPDKAAAYASRQASARTLLGEHIDVHLCSSSRMRDLYLANGFDAGRIRILRQEAPGNDLLWQRTGNQRKIVDPLARPLRVGFLGSVMPHKGVHILTAALQAFSPGEVECVVLGEQQRDYAQYLRTIDPKQRVHLYGAYAYAALPQLLGALDVVVVPSLVEEIGPMVVGEALAARCPVIGSRIGGIPDFVEHGTNGFLFSPGNVQELTECLRAFRRDPGLLGRMQRAIVAPRGLHAFCVDLLSIYDDLASRAVGSSANAAMTTAPPAARTVARRPSLALA
ncbi:MAG: glycosyltransferase [Planctomycetes bacterium]|jgi:glycosyltransferase involved in cell wall biosynthesis|nr:glycosyltransferase [Planctomycetota bacterium]